MSYSRLVADAIHSQPAGEQLAYQIVLFDIQRSSSEMTYGECMHQRGAILFFDERALSRFPHSIGDHVHRSFEIQFFPASRIWPAILHFLQALGVSVEFVSIGTLR